MDNFSMDVFNRYSNFRPKFELVSYVVSSNGTKVSEYESVSPIKNHKYHLQVEEDGVRNRGRYSFI